MMLVLGVGNEMMGDDAFGPLVVKELEGKTKAKLWSGSNPENYIGKIKKPLEKLVILDAAYMKKEPGSVKIIEPREIRERTISTHKIPLSMVMRQLEANSTYYIVAQPKDVEFGTEPSKEIKKAAKKASRMVLEILR